MLSSPDQWLLLLLNYVLHSSLLVALALILVRFKAITKPGTKEYLWKFVLIGGFITTLIQAQVHTSLFKISAGMEPPTQEVSSAPEKGLNLPDIAYEPSGLSQVESFSEEESLSSSKTPIPLWAQFIGAISLLLSLHFIISRSRFLKALQMTETDDPAINAILHDLSTRFQLSHTIQLLSSERLKSPIAISRGSICIPERSIKELNHDQMKSMLAHEVAHIDRKDPQWLFFMNIIVTLFWFQPLNRLVRNRVKQAMEDGADRMAVKLTRDPVTFSETLLTVARWGQSSGVHNHALSFAGNSSLKNRVRAVLTMEKEPKTKRSAILLALVALIGLVSFACPELAHEDQTFSPETPALAASQESELKTPQSAKAERSDKQPYQVPSNKIPALRANAIDHGSKQQMTPVSLASLNAQNAFFPESEMEKNESITVSNEKSPAELPGANDVEIVANLDQEGESELSDNSHSLQEMARLVDTNYQRFKRDFWPMLIASGLLNKRVNTVELTYQTLTVNGRVIHASRSRRFRLLIETHFDRSHWMDFQYRRDGVKPADMKRSVASMHTAPETGAEKPSEWGNDRIQSQWKEYRAELAQNLLEDGVIQSISDNISIKWRKDKVFINRKKFKGADFLKYRSIKDKHFSTPAT